MHDPETGEITTAEFRRDEPVFPLPVIYKMECLWGDLRDAILDRLRAMPKPYTIMSEREQIDMITGVEQVSRHLVTQACRIIAANGHAAFRAVPDGFKNKGDDVTIQLKAVGTDLAHALLEHKGAPVMIVLAAPEAYMGEKAPAKPDPDEPALPLDKAEESGEVVSIKRGRGRPRKDGAPAHPKKTSDSALLPPIPTSAMPHIHKAKSLEELLTVRFPNGATMAMIINEGLRSSEVSDYMAQGKIALVDDHYIWEDNKPVESEERDFTKDADRAYEEMVEDPPDIPGT